MRRLITGLYMLTFLFLLSACTELSNLISSPEIPPPDTYSWTLYDSQCSGLYQILYPTQKFYAFSPTMVAISSDGASWECISYKFNNPDFDSFGALDKVAFGNELFIGISGMNVYRSNDGIQWDYVQLSPTTDAAFVDITYGAGKFIILDGNGYIYISNDGTNWQEASLNINSDLFERIIYTNDLFIILEQSTMFTSIDGNEWVVSEFQKQNCSSNLLFDIIYGNGLYVAVGSAEAVYTSSDGVHWVERHCASPYSPPGEYKAIAYGDGRFVAVGDSLMGTPTILVSQGGISWEERSLPVDVSLGELSDIIFENGKFVAVGYDFIITSP